MLETSQYASVVTTSKRYKPSRFNVHTMAPDGSLILFNTYNGHCCVIPQEGSRQATVLLSQRGFEGELNALGLYLWQNGHLLDTNVNENLRWDLAYGMQHYRTDHLSLVLFPSEECNFRCQYCSQPFEHGTMSPIVVESIKKLLQKRITKLSRLEIAWFGGEPLLGYEVIAELAPFFSNIARANEVAYNTNITTNGYMLTSERARNLIQWGVSQFQITVDGMPEDHNRSRPLKDGGETFDTIMSNLQDMHEMDEPFEVRLRLNFDKDNIHSLDQYFELIRERLEGDPRFLLALTPVGAWGGPNDSTLHMYTDDSMKCQVELGDRAQSMGIPIEPAMRLTKGRVVCFATLAGGLIIGADGRLLKCTNHGAFPNELNSVGRLREDGYLDLQKEISSKWILPYYNLDTKCKRCFYLPICRGGMMCPSARVRGLTPDCPREKTHIRSILLQYWEARREEITTTIHVSVSSGEQLEVRSPNSDS